MQNYSVPVSAFHLAICVMFFSVAASGISPASGPPAPPQPITGSKQITAPSVATGGRQAESNVQPEAVVAESLDIGKWPERMVFVGETLWIAESGQRTLVDVDPFELQVRRRLEVGRLPVGLSRDENDTIYVSVVTDRVIKRVLFGSSMVTPVTEIEGTIDLLDMFAETLWALTWPTNSSDRIQLVAIDPARRQIRKLPQMTSPNDFSGTVQGFAVAGDKAWLGFSSGDLLVINTASGEIEGQLQNPAFSIRSVATDGTFVAIGGVAIHQPGEGGLGIIQAKTMQGTEKTLPGEIRLVAVAEGFVIAVDNIGQIFVIQPKTGKLVRHLKPTTPIPEPRAIEVIGYQIFLTSHGVGEAGKLFSIKNWAPRVSAPQQ